MHLLPRFGDVPLAKITNLMVRRLIADMLETGRHEPATVRKVGQILAKHALVRGRWIDSPLAVRRGPAPGRRSPRDALLDHGPGR